MANKSELYDRAGELGIANRDGLTKAQLADAILEKEAKGNPIEEPMPEQTGAAKTKDVEQLAEDTISEDKRVVNAAERELEDRNAKAAVDKAAESRKRKLPQQYLITKGCNIFSNGCITRLAEGSIVSAMTHNLKTIKDTGGEMKECKGTKLMHDQFGRLITVPIL